MGINLPTEQWDAFYSGLENIADAIVQDKGDISDEKLMAIIEFVGLERNKETINQTKLCASKFEEIFNSPEMSVKQAFSKVTRLGIPQNSAELVIGILIGSNTPLQYMQNSLIPKRECPACNANEIESLTKGRLCCSKCGASFLKEGSKYKLIDINDKNSTLWVRCKNLPLAYKDWFKLKNCGYRVHFDMKTNAYIPYMPDQYSEYKNTASRYSTTPSVPPPTAKNIPETTKSVEKFVNIEKKEQRRASLNKPRSVIHSEKYYVTNAGKFLLGVTVDDLSKARDYLKRFKEGSSLTNKELEYLLKRDLLDEKLL